MALLSDGAFKAYMHACLTADRSTGRLKIAQGDIATALKKSRRSIVNYLDELREHEICSIEAARNQHVTGDIEVCDPFWPYVKCRGDQDSDKELSSYVEAIRQLLAVRKCVNPVFNPADEKLAAQLFREALG
jgi:DNA-binding transcriptional regulator LsrR (DeoR family)